MKTIERILGFLFKVIGGTIVVLGAILALFGDFGIAAQKGTALVIGIISIFVCWEIFDGLYLKKKTTGGDEEK